MLTVCLCVLFFAGGRWVCKLTTVTNTKGLFELVKITNTSQLEL